MTLACSKCGPVSLTPAQQLGGKIFGGSAGAVFGANVAKEPLIGLVCGLLGIWIGNEIDKRCPICGSILQVLEPMIFSGM
jgi:hypothetical protein